MSSWSLRVALRTPDIIGVNFALAGGIETYENDDCDGCPPGLFGGEDGVLTIGIPTD